MKHIITLRDGKQMIISNHSWVNCLGIRVGEYCAYYGAITFEKPTLRELFEAVRWFLTRNGLWAG